MPALEVVLPRAALGLLPALCFLAALVALDSYKLVRLRAVLAVIVLGGLLAGVSYFANAVLLEWLDLPFRDYSRYVAPIVEETLKAAVILALVRAERIGFLVDAAIFGFAVGTGFALVENLLYLRTLGDGHMAVWVVRGFGTAVMHGGVQAIFAVAVVGLSERLGGVGARAVLPPLAVAIAIHSAFNHFVLPPILQTLAVLLLLPPLLWLVFVRSERSVRDWLSMGFDADTQLLALIDSGGLSEAPVGKYLETLRQRFRGEVVADLLCYLRLVVELTLRAKGVLLMRADGFEVAIDAATREKFEEMRYLERSVGPTALLALKPFLSLNRKDLWQLYMLGK